MNNNKNTIKFEKKDKKEHKKKNLSKFTLLRCLEEYFDNKDHDEALAITEYIWKHKDKF